MYLFIKKKKFLEASREEIATGFTRKMWSTKMASEFSTATSEATRQWTKASKFLREIISKLEFYTQPNYQAKCEGKIKSL